MVAGAAVCVALSGPVFAQLPVPTSLPGNPRLVSDPDAQMLVEADQMIYDYDNETVTAQGNVQIYYDGRTLEAAEVVYEQRTRQLTARGGVKITEPAADLPVLLAIMSSLRDRPLPRGLVAFGEVGLAGEIRPAVRGQERLKEAAKLGFSMALIPRANAPRQPIEGLEIVSLDRIDAAMDRLR